MEWRVPWATRLPTVSAGRSPRRVRGRSAAACAQRPRAHPAGTGRLRRPAGRRQRPARRAAPRRRTQRAAQVSTRRADTVMATGWSQSPDHEV